MAKKKRNSTISFVAFLTVAAIVAVYLACYTFARYSTSAGNSTASSIALWDVTITPKIYTTIPDSSSYSGAVSFGKLSPGVAVSDPSQNTVEIDDTTYYYLVKNSSTPLLVADFSYLTDVDLIFCIEVSDYTVTFTDNSTMTYSDSEVTYTEPDTSTEADTSTETNTSIACCVYNNNKNSETLSLIDNEKLTEENNKITDEHNYESSPLPKASDITGLYELEFYVDGTTDKFTEGTNYNYKEYTANYLSSSSDKASHSIYGIMTWQVKVTEYNSENNYYWATYLCDWVGKYVTNVSCTITYSAVQASEIHIQE